jgi:hypothetical protein
MALAARATLPVGVPVTEVRVTRRDGIGFLADEQDAAMVTAAILEAVTRARTNGS